MTAQMGTEVVPLSESERRAMSAWLKRGRHSKRADRAAHAEHARSRMRTLLQGPQPSQPPTGGPPITPAQLVYSGPVNALSIAYRVANIAQPVGLHMHALLFWMKLINLVAIGVALIWLSSFRGRRQKVR